MGKIILFLVLAAVAFLVIKSAMRNRNRMKRGDKRASAEPESMKACAHCGLNVPRSEAIESDGRYYCSEGHRRLGVR